VNEYAAYEEVILRGQRPVY